MWKCACCSAEIESNFDACWKCGASIDGKPASAFEHADNYRPEILPPKRQYTLAILILVLTGCCIAFAGIATRNPMLFVLGFGLLSLMIACSVIPNQIHKWQRRATTRIEQ